MRHPSLGWPTRAWGTWVVPNHLTAMRHSSLSTTHHSPELADLVPLWFFHSSVIISRRRAGINGGAAAASLVALPSAAAAIGLWRFLNCTGLRTPARISLPPDGPFTISGAFNRFTAIGCDTVTVCTADGGGPSQHGFTSDCVSLCAAGGGVSLGCSDMECCESAIPEEEPEPGCEFQFRGDDLREFPSVRAGIALRLDWAVGDGHGRRTTLLAAVSAYCVPSVRGRKHLCYCSAGFSGNS